MTWTIDIPAVERLKADLGIREPIDIAFATPADDVTTGRYSGLQDGVHRVMLAPDTEPQNANWYLCHELAHVAQSEKLGNGWPWYDRVTEELARVVDDRLAQFEIEATARADELAPQHTLIVAAT